MPIAADFSVASNGDIRWTGTTGAYATLELHRWVQDMADDMEAAGFPDVEFHLFPGGHQMSEEEREALVAWWLG